MPDFGRMLLTLKYTDITQNSYVCPKLNVTEIMAREKCGLLVVPRTVPVWRVVTCTLRMSVLQSHSRVKHILPTFSTDVTVTVNCNSILLDIHVPCKVLGTLRTTTALVPVFMDFNLIALYHSYVNYMLSTDINITETTYSW